ncbi:MAG: hypothetical protein HY201_04985 [Nitrospirae bacterium]|nr:hypothetical protein [Candidatus Troglogloeales bacterium]MBI3598783.1 hypothetical protein [Candidatus Troglogloeales bacterium]
MPNSPAVGVPTNIGRDADCEKKAILNVAIAIIKEDDSLLIAQRRADSHLAGLWEFTGGKQSLSSPFMKRESN